MPHELVTVDGDGNARWHDTVLHAPASLARRVPVSLVSAGGNASQVDAVYYSYDHLPGGWVMFPKTEGVRNVRAELVVNNRFVVAQRQ